MSSFTDQLRVNWTEPTLWYAALSIFLCPAIWNAVARLEYYTQSLTKLAGGNKYYGAYGLAAWIFITSGFRDFLFFHAMEHQPTAEFAYYDIVVTIGYIMAIVGSVLVLTSMWKLGITGTYLGDYFGIYMDRMVTSFPFDVLNHPMYTGAALNFFGGALKSLSPAGVVLSVWVVIVYAVFSAFFEGPFTRYIYANRHKRYN